jgi:arabinofuranosyltransferase
MKLKLAIALCSVILLAGATIQTLAGSSFLSPRSENDWGNDDAYISYRYAENLVHGRGLVFNPGERVEAYSNLLYVLLMVPGFLLTGQDGIYFYSVTINLLLAAAALLLFMNHLRRLGQLSAFAGGVLVALCLPLWVAVASGLESVLVVALALGIWIAVERAVREESPPLWPLVALTALMVLARADGFIVPALAVVYLAIKGRRREAVASGAALAGTLIALEAWRYTYYGAWLPTSYYVKIAGPLSGRVAHAGIQILKIGFFEGLMPYVLVLLLAAAGALWRVSRGEAHLVETIEFHWFYGVAWLLYWFYIGGDHFWDRFLIVLFPLGIYELLYLFTGRVERPAAVWALALLLLYQVGPPYYTDPRFDYIAHKYDCWVGVGKFLRERYPGRTLAAASIGKIPFFSGLYTIDMLGLGTPAIAHEGVAAERFEPGHVKYDPDYVLSRRPDIVVGPIGLNRNLSFGVTRDKYLPAGYHVSYLVNTLRPPPGPPIVDVRGLDDAAVDRLIVQRYDFAVLIRN